MSWRAVAAMVEHPWQPAEYLQAAIVDLLHWLTWSKTEDAAHGRNVPEPIPRPGDARRAAIEAQERIDAAIAAGLIVG